MRLWDLPGVKRFIETACAPLRDGSSVVARFPGEIPTGFEEALTTSLGNILSVGRLCGSASPFEDLCNRFAAGNRSHIQSLQDLCEDEGFAGRLIWIDGLNGENWPAWRAFLSKYAQASRSMPFLGRTLFFAPLAGPSLGDPPSTDVALVTCEWDGVPDELDLMLFANEYLRQISLNTVLRDLLATTVARVASWDFDSAICLLRESKSSILAPAEVLRSVAQEKGWTQDTPVAWEFGTASQSGIAHPARAALEDPYREIERRVWSAQASVLLPRIETWRHETVKQNIFTVRGLMRRTGKEDVDPYELEIGELVTLFEHTGGHRSVRKRVRKLRNARNALAHLRPLRPDVVLRLIEANGGET